MTFEEFLKKVKDWENDNDNFAASLDSEDAARGALEEWGGEVIENWGGEGLGDTVRLVIHFKEGDLYVKAEGYYASYDGSDWDSADWREVRPKDTTVVVYE